MRKPPCLAIAAGVLAAMLAAAMPARAESAGKVLRVGLLSDMSGVYADYFGEGSVLAARLAIEDYGGKVAGMPIELVTADHLNKPDIGVAIVRRWIDNEGVDVILDVPTSSVALAVSAVVREKNKVFLASAPFTSALTGTGCSPNTVHWTLDNWALSNSVSKAVVETGGRSWFFLSADYAFGHDLEQTARDAIAQAGGTVLGAVRHPLDTHDLSSFLLQAQTSKADVIGLANAGADTTNAIKQAVEFGITKRGQKLAGLATVINNVHEVGLESSAGLFAAGPFYWDLDDGTRAWSKRFAEHHRKHAMPDDMQAGAYGALLHYLKAVEALGNDADGRAVVDRMKATPSEDPLFGKGSIRIDGRGLHPMYLFQVKTPAESRAPWDYYKLVRTIPAEQAFRPLDQGHCPFVGGG
jgi:branched-chain amino acid transport system substrate-binding protein